MLVTLQVTTKKLEIRPQWSPTVTHLQKCQSDEKKLDVIVLLFRLDKHFQIPIRYAEKWDLACQSDQGRGARASGHLARTWSTPPAANIYSSTEFIRTKYSQ